jgi:hypothetical protein
VLDGASVEGIVAGASVNGDWDGWWLLLTWGCIDGIGSFVNDTSIVGSIDSIKILVGEIVVALIGLWIGIPGTLLVGFWLKTPTGPLDTGSWIRVGPGVDKCIGVAAGNSVCLVLGNLVGTIDKSGWGLWVGPTVDNSVGVTIGDLVDWEPLLSIAPGLEVKGANNGLFVGGDSFVTFAWIIICTGSVNCVGAEDGASDRFSILGLVAFLCRR